MRPEDNNVTAASSMTGSATGPQTEEHRKTGRAGYLVLGWSVVFMAITVLSFALDYNSAIWWTTAGICVALFIVGILLVLESERSASAGTNVVSRRLWPEGNLQISGGRVVRQRCRDFGKETSSNIL